MEKNTTKKDFRFTVKNALKLLAVICFICLFCPSCLVSCSGQTVGVSAMGAAVGVIHNGQFIEEGHPIMYICILLPCAIFSFLTPRKYKNKDKVTVTTEVPDRVSAAVILVFSVIDMVIWTIFVRTVEKYAAANYCSCEITLWFALKVIVSILIIVLSALVLFGVLRMESDLFGILNGDGTQAATGQMSDNLKQIQNIMIKPSGDAINSMKRSVSKTHAVRYCPNCGNPVEAGAKFCGGCGYSLQENASQTNEE